MFRLNSISGKLVIVIVLILPIFVWQLGTDTIQSLRSYDDMKVLDHQNAAANTLIAGVYEILLERLATNNALLAEQPAGSDVLSAIEKNRLVAVAKVSAAYADLSGLEFPNKAGLLGELKAAIEKANNYRAKADTAVKQAKAARDADTVKNLFVSLSELSAASQKVWGAVLSNTSEYDPELGRLSNLRTLAWNLREIAGIERSHIAAAIPSKSAIPADKLTAMTNMNVVNVPPLTYLMVDGQGEPNKSKAFEQGFHRAADLQAVLQRAGGVERELCARSQK